MSTSERKIEANRRNAQKSTGPKTPEGKAISSRNNTIHGIYAKGPVVTLPRLNESDDEYARLFTTLAIRLGPSTILQLALVRRIADGVWRQKRADSAMAALKAGTILPARRLFEDLLSNDRRTDRVMGRSFDLLRRLQSGAISDPTAENSGDAQPEPNSEGGADTNA